jgi:hypothetical protein
MGSYRKILMFPRLVAEVFGAGAKYGALTWRRNQSVPLTGTKAAPFQVRLEGGGYGYFRGEISGALSRVRSMSSVRLVLESATDSC